MNLLKILFSGRISVSEFWFGYLLMMLMLFPFTEISPLYPYTGGNEIFLKTIGLPIAFLITIWIVSLAIRRLHDLGHSGFYILVTLIPLIGALFSLYYAFAPGQKESNKYGPPVNKTRGILKNTLGI